MSISANFPHQLALLVIGLQTDKLPICQHLEDPTEKSLVASLMTYMNNRDFRTPITIARKTLGVQIRVKRSTLFNKLRNLKEKGLIEDVTGELPIRFTEKAIALMQLDWTKQADRWKEKQPVKKPTFRVGSSTFPSELVQLINRGVSEKQLRALLCEAKKAGKKIQDILLHFETSLTKYSGKVLFLVIRDILRKPEKYLKADKKVGATPRGDAVQAGRHADLLRTALDNVDCILDSGEQLRQIDGHITFAGEANGYRTESVNSEHVDMLMQRMRDAVLCYANKNPEWELRNHGAGITMKLDAEASSGRMQPIMVLHGGRTVTGEWHVLYAALPPSARQIQLARNRDNRIGRQLIRRGISYLVDAISGGVCALRVLTGKQAGTVCTVPDSALADPEIAWVRT